VPGVNALPRVSIGVPVYNGDRYLAQALESILGQTLDDLEVVVCDNASSDGTEEIARSIAARDSRVRYVRNAENLGVAANFNKTFHLSRAKYFKWSSSDDLCAPTLVERCVECLDEHPDAMLAYGRTRLINGAGTPLRDIDENLHLLDPLPSSRFLNAIRALKLCNVHYGVMRSELLRRTRLLGNYPHSDTVLIPEMSLYGTFHELPEVLFSRRLHGEASSSFTTDEQFIAYYLPHAAVAPRFMDWRLILEHARSVLRARVGIAERVRLLGIVARLVSWNRNSLARELISPRGSRTVGRAGTE